MSVFGVPDWPRTCDHCHFRVQEVPKTTTVTRIATLGNNESCEDCDPDVHLSDSSEDRDLDLPESTTVARMATRNRAKPVNFATFTSRMKKYHWGGGGGRARGPRIMYEPWYLDPVMVCLPGAIRACRNANFSNSSMHITDTHAAFDGGWNSCRHAGLNTALTHDVHEKSFMPPFCHTLPCKGKIQAAMSKSSCNGACRFGECGSWDKQM